MQLQKELDKVSYNLINNDTFSAPSYIGELIFFSNYNIELLSVKKLEFLIEHISKNPNLSFFYGTLGVASLLRDLVENSILDKDELEVLDEEIDVFILETVQDDLLNKNYDLLNGMITKGIYFLKAGKYIYVKQILENIYNIKRIYDGTYRWPDYLNKSYNKTEPLSFNLGLAHGIPAIVSFAALCYKHQINNDLCKSLINNSVPFLLAQKSTAQQPFLFPMTAECDNLVTTGASRLGWCYGDLGIAIALWHCGVALSNAQYKSEALSIMTNATKINIEDSGVYYSKKHMIYDPGFCHGTSGIAHIFLRFYQATSNKIFLERAHYWLSFATQQFDSPSILFPRDITKDHWHESYGLLEGLSGLGLVIQSFINNDTNRNWDEFLLTNISEKW